jgi:Niemann-Pick C1 protein
MCAHGAAAHIFPASAGVKERPLVYVYSIFHPFFEQYLTIAGYATFILIFALLGVMAATAIFTASLPLAAILASCLASLLLNMLGVMVHLGVQLNAVSLVNLTMSMGIAVEFVVHIAQGFLIASGTRFAPTPVAVLPSLKKEHSEHLK